MNTFIMLTRDNGYPVLIKSDCISYAEEFPGGTDITLNNQRTISVKETLVQIQKKINDKKEPLFE